MQCTSEQSYIELNREDDIDTSIKGTVWGLNSELPVSITDIRGMAGGQVVGQGAPRFQNTDTPMQHQLNTHSCCIYILYVHVLLLDRTS